jgi:hypothetical protein
MGRPRSAQPEEGVEIAKPEDDGEAVTEEIASPLTEETQSARYGKR